MVSRSGRNARSRAQWTRISADLSPSWVGVRPVHGDQVFWVAGFRFELVPRFRSLVGPRGAGNECRSTRTTFSFPRLITPPRPRDYLERTSRTSHASTNNGRHRLTRLSISFHFFRPVPRRGSRVVHGFVYLISLLYGRD